MKLMRRGISFCFIIVALLICYVQADLDDHIMPFAPETMRAYLNSQDVPNTIPNKYIVEWEQNIKREFGTYSRNFLYKKSERREDCNAPLLLINRMSGKLSPENPLQIQLLLFKALNLKKCGTNSERKTVGLSLINASNAIKAKFPDRCPIIDKIYHGQISGIVSSLDDLTAEENQVAKSFLDENIKSQDLYSRINANSHNAVFYAEKSSHQDLVKALPYFQEYFKLLSEDFRGKASAEAYYGSCISSRIVCAYNRFYEVGRKDLANQLTRDIEMDTLKSRDKELLAAIRLEK